ncbi:cupredoxin domain-containing protein [Halomonas salinarum]|uniref:cupredoxin domain-containing protein n=1 Tax=Halomonas salinarum TaxID=1158993 RepID=UPI0014394753|nr:cupredoxin domain-containing protein [Halomonas salinarum]
MTIPSLFTHGRPLALMLLMAVTLGGLASPAAAQQDTVEVRVTAQSGFQFEPSQIEVPVGTEVKLTLENAAVMGHDLSIPALDVATSIITGEETSMVSFTVGEAGVYSFRCEVPGHAEAGMIGKVKAR